MRLGRCDPSACSPQIAAVRIPTIQSCSILAIGCNVWKVVLMKSILHNANVPALRYTLATLAAAFAFAAMWLWAIEVWQRPLRTIHLDENWMRFAAISASLIAMIAWPGNLRRRWWLRAGIWATVCTSVGFCLHFAAREAAARALFKHPLVIEASWSWITTPPPSPPGFWSEIFAELRDKIQFPAIDRYHPDDEYLPHLIETSRWPVRRAWIEKVMRNQGAAFLVTAEWNHYFPAVVGQDVTLRNRRELIELLNDIHLDPSLSHTNRDAAVLWMSLIVLTDPVEFADRRVQVRDAMLKQNHPPWAGREDVGMRMIDALLAFDTHDEAARLTQRFLDDDYLTRRALRERVRGFDAHVDAIIQTIEGQERTINFRYSAAMLVDLIQMVSRMSDEAAAARTRDWIQKTYLQWIDYPYHTIVDFGHHQENSISHDLRMLFQEEQMQSLAKHAEQILIEAKNPLYGESSRGRRDPVSQAMLIWILLDERRQNALSRQIADFIAEKASASQIASRYDSYLLKIWNDLSDTHQQHFSGTLRQKLETQLATDGIGGGHRSLAMSYWVHPSLGLTEAETLALIAIRGHYNMIHMREAPTPPEFSTQGVEVYLDACENAVGIPADQSIRIGDDGTLAFPPGMLNHMFDSPNRGIISPATLPPRTHFLLSLIQRGIVSPEHLGEDLLPVARVSPMLVLSIFRDPHFDSMSLLLDEKDDFRFLRVVLESHDAQIFEALPEALKNHSIPQDAIDIITTHFLCLTTIGDLAQRIRAYKILFELEEHLASSQRDILRREFSDFLERERPSLDEWEPLAKRNHFHAPVNRMEWGDDDLSARFGWMGSIYTETAHGLMARHKHPDIVDEVFFHLANASTATPLRQRRLSLEDVMTSDDWNTRPPKLPLSPTPWQQARELHLRRPDLDFPDRALFRPTRRNR